MPGINSDAVQQYLESVVGPGVTVDALKPLGADPQSTGVKGYGYGVPVRIEYRTADRQPHQAVLHTMSPGPFGHEHMADRAQILLWQHQAFNRLDRHVRALDVAGFQEDGRLLSVGQIQELCLLTEYAEGKGYNLDLERLRDHGTLNDQDLARADALCDYLATIHHTPVPEPDLYLRRNRELVGSGECIMGLLDSFPMHPLFPRILLEDIEHRCVSWRWRLKPLKYRLRQVHGDFHPWNILFREGVEFTLLDRSRGEYGDPADDVACITANYLFFSLQRSGRLEGCFETLFQRFWTRYLDRTGDQEILRVAAPFFVFRALVMASPVWYPNLPDDARRKLIAFMLSLLEQEIFDPTLVNKYCER